MTAAVASARTGRHRGGSSRGRLATTRRFVLLAVVTTLSFVAVAVLAYLLTGGRAYAIRTPSMGTTAPVGSLVLTRPTTVAHLRVGDIVAFHPKDARNETYTHRVVRIADGRLTTRGDINGADDPWATTDADLVGKVDFIGPGLGFLVRALPLLTLGGIVLTVVTRYWLRPAWRGPVRMVGVAVLYLVAAVTIRPFVNVVQVATRTTGDDAQIAAVSTGLLPIRLTPVSGKGTAEPVDMRYGQVGTSHLAGAPADGHYQLAAHLHLSWFGWLVIGFVCALPMLWVLLVGFRRSDDLDGAVPA